MPISDIFQVRQGWDHVLQNVVRFALGNPASKDWVPILSVCSGTMHAVRQVFKDDVYFSFRKCESIRDLDELKHYLKTVKLIIPNIRCFFRVVTDTSGNRGWPGCINRFHDRISTIMNIPPANSIPEQHMYRYDGIEVPTHQWLHDNLAKRLIGWTPQSKWNLSASVLKHSSQVNVYYNPLIYVITEGGEYISLVDGFDPKADLTDQRMHWHMVGSFDIWSSSSQSEDFRGQIVILWWFLLLILQPDDLRLFYASVMQSDDHTFVINRHNQSGPILNHISWKGLRPTWECLCTEAMRVLRVPST